MKLIKRRPVGIVDINDCYPCANAEARVSGRTAKLFPRIPMKGVGIPPNDEVLGLMLLDTVDSFDGAPSIILGNSAPRTGSSNGNLFASFWVGRTLVVTTTAGRTLSLLKDHGLIRTGDVRVHDTTEVVQHQLRKGIIKDPLRAQRMIRGQFRSLEVRLPIARWLWDGSVFSWLTGRPVLPSSPLAEHIPNLPENTKACYIDVFGNVKLTRSARSLGLHVGDIVSAITPFGRRDLILYDRLADVPDGELALVTGSSGSGENDRLLEVVSKGLDGPSALDRLLERPEVEVA